MFQSEYIEIEVILKTFDVEGDIQKIISKEHK